MIVEVELDQMEPPPRPRRVDCGSVSIRQSKQTLPGTSAEICGAARARAAAGVMTAGIGGEVDNHLLGSVSA